MAPDPPTPPTIVHATLEVQFLQRLSLPPMPDVERQNLKKRDQLQRKVFCKVYSALLEDVEALDPQLQSKFSREIIRIICAFAASFRIREQQQPELQDFSQRLGRFEHGFPSLGAVQGLSGATVLDYLVGLMTEKAGFRKMSNLDIYQRRLADLKLAKAIHEVLKMEEDSAKDNSSGGSKENLSPKATLRGIGLPSILFICVGPHKHHKIQREGQGHPETEGSGMDENKTEEKEKNQRILPQSNKDQHEKDQHEKDQHEKNHHEKGRHEKVHGNNLSLDIHVVASSTEGFSDTERKRWAQRMHYERMRSVSIQSFERVCATELRFFNTLGGRNVDEPSRIVHRANVIPNWQTMHHWPDASTSNSALGTSSTGSPDSEPDERIGVFNHSCETAAAFNVASGFERRARCFKCQSLYLYRQDAASIRAEADIKGPHRSEPMYKWLPKPMDGQGNGTNQNGEDVSGPSCAEPLCHILCAELM